MLTVHKYTLPAHTSIISVHGKPQWLTAGLQGWRIVVWALVDTDAEQTSHVIQAINTDTPAKLERGAQYIGTVTVGPASVVWHVFDDGPFTESET